MNLLSSWELVKVGADPTLTPSLPPVDCIRILYPVQPPPVCSLCISSGLELPHTYDRILVDPIGVFRVGLPAVS